MLSLPRLRVLAAVARHGSVTAAAEALHYAQASVSHHLARLEAETGAVLTQRVGRGIRLTEAGRLLAARAEEILGRLDTAEREIAALTGLAAGRVRLAAFPSALGTFVPAALAALAADVPGLEVSLVEAEPPAALRLLRAGAVDVAVVFGYPTEPVTAGPVAAEPVTAEPVSAGSVTAGSVAAGPEPSGTGLRGTDLLAEPVWLVTAEPAGPELAAYRDARWIAGCDRCRTDLLRRCAAAGFVPDVAFTTDDYVAVQRLVAAGVGVAALPGLALTAHRHPAVATVPVPGWIRTVRAVSYGAPPDPPGVAALLAALATAAGVSTVYGQSGLGSPTGVVVKPPPSSSSPGAGDDPARIRSANRSASSRGE